MTGGLAVESTQGRVENLSQSATRHSRLRILHVVPRGADYQTETAVEQLTNASTIESRRFDLSLQDFHSTRTFLNWRRQPPDADLIHAWGDAALKLAAVSTHRPIFYSPMRFPTAQSIRWLRAISGYRDVTVIAPSETARRAFVQRGVPMERCHAVPPGVDFGRADRSRGRSLRESLGFSAEDRVMLAVGESDRSADHARTLWAAVILHVLDRKYRILLWGRGPLAGPVRRFAEKLQQPELFVVATDRLGSSVRFDEIIGAADVGVVSPISPTPTLAIALCMAAGLPLVSATDSTICELLEDRHNALLTTTRAPRPIARRVMDMLADPVAAAQYANVARAEAFERFSRTRFVEAVAAVYRTVVDLK